MKSVLAFLLIAVLAFQAQARTTQSPDTMDLAKYIEKSKCLAKENLVFADIVDFFMNDKIESADNNRKLKCFASCLLDFDKILDGCSVVFYKKTKMDAFPSGDKKDEFIKLFESCKSVVKGTDRCECGYQFVKCMAEKSKKN